VKLTSIDELERYAERLNPEGSGGTDFRPAFAYVDGLIKAGEFSDFKELIYFTDGFGVFPAQRPEYDAAFVFLDTQDDPPALPVWAIKQVVTAEEVAAL